MIKIFNFALSAIGTILALCVVSYLLNWPQPASSQALYKRQVQLEQGVKGDQVIGGGDLFPNGDENLWTRFRVQDGLPVSERLIACSPKELEVVRSWFLHTVSHSNRLLWVIPLV